MKIEYVSTLEEIGGLILEITKLKKGKRKPAPKDVILESRIAETTAVSIEDVEKIGEKSVFACPDCGGNLWTVKGDIINRYRCHIGHAYTEKDLSVKQAEVASTTLWVALRMMEERKHLLKKMAVDSRKKGYKSQSTRNEEKHDEMQQHIDRLKKILFDLQNQETG